MTVEYHYFSMFSLCSSSVSFHLLFFLPGYGYVQIHFTDIASPRRMYTAFVSECKQQGHKVNAPGGSSSGDTSSDPSTTGPAGSASSAGSSSPSSKEPGGLAKSNGSVVGPNAFGALGLSAVAAVVTIATLGVSFG